MARRLNAGSLGTFKMMHTLVIVFISILSIALSQMSYAQQKSEIELSKLRQSEVDDFYGCGGRYSSSFTDYNYLMRDATDGTTTFIYLVINDTNEILNLTKRIETEEQAILEYEYENARYQATAIFDRIEMSAYEEFKVKVVLNLMPKNNAIADTTFTFYGYQGC